MAHPSRSPYAQFGVALLALGFLAIAAWQACALTQLLYQSVASRFWVAVPGQIVEAQLQHSTVQSSHSRPGTSEHPASVYQAQGRYLYQYQGRRYVGHQLSFAQGSDNSRWHQELIQTLSLAQTQGQTVTVYVNPKRPEQAVIWRGSSPTEWVMLTLFVLLFGGLGWILLAEMRQYRRR